MERIQVKHPFGPFVQKDSKILILGSFPSVKSRENEFYYGHPQNRFWKVLAAVCKDEVPVTLEKKKEFLIRHQIALWDVIDSCRLIGSSDASIQDAEVCDIESLMKNSSIEKVLINGKTAEKILRKHYPNLSVVCLPSTSPANAAFSLERLIEAYQKEFSRP